jgi:hypothetical protein
MAGSKLNTYGVGDVNLTNLMQVLDACRIGFHAVSLTEWATTTVPKIAAGSKVEVNGAIYKFDADETITGSPSDGLVYIKLIPSGDSITAQFTNTAPAWDDEKQGWYSSTPGEENYRYIEFGMTKATAEYSDKYRIVRGQDSFEIKHYNNGNVACNRILPDTVDCYNIRSAEQFIQGTDVDITIYRPCVFKLRVANGNTVDVKFIDSLGTYLIEQVVGTSPHAHKVYSLNPGHYKFTRSAGASTFNLYLHSVFGDTSAAFANSDICTYTTT